jgi:hypothetical protein
VTPTLDALAVEESRHRRFILFAMRQKTAVESALQTPLGNLQSMAYIK